MVRSPQAWFPMTLFTLVMPLLALWALLGRTDESASAWKEAMRATHARFTGQQGTFAQFGDSITVTRAFWSPLRYARHNAPAEMERAFRTVNAYLRPECWQEWKGPEYGSEGGQTSRWARENIDGWLRRLNPEVALILFGTNDLHSLDLASYRENLRAVVQRCLDNGTVVILSTIPPRHGFEKRAEEFSAAVGEIARQMKVPLIDFRAEILQRRPDDWDGALEKFRNFEGYDVPTLLARDGVHPSHPKRYQDDYSEEALKCCGYSLRNYLTLMKYAEVLEALRAAPAEEKAKAPDNGSPIFLRPPNRPWFPKAPPLPPPSGEVIRVATADQLYEAVERVKPGGTILLADGFYSMPRPLDIRTDNVTLRSASGNREKVILDGGKQGELIRLTACSGVTIADLTVQNVRWNGIKLNSETNVQKVTIRNCILHNIWQRAVKGTLVPATDREKIRPSDCRVEYCLFYNDRPKQFADDPADTPANFNGNYIGGIDVMFARNWIIRDNVFVGIRGRTGEARGAIFVWHDSVGCLIERNIILDCDSGICLGNSHRPADVTVHCTGFLVRNNFVVRAPENGILADYTRDCKILHNTVYDPKPRLDRGLRLVHDNDGLFAANNLFCGPRILYETASRIDVRNNLERDISAALVDPASGNLRLTARAVEAIDKAERLADVPQDIDGTPRGEKPDIGAHEFRP